MTQYLLELRKTHNGEHLILCNKKPLSVTNNAPKKLVKIICQFAKEGKL